MFAISTALALAAAAHGARFERGFSAAKFEKAALHVHTDASDGDEPAATAAAWYAANGFRFAALTDHDLLVSTRAPKGLVLVPGVEVTSWSRSEKKPVHANALCAERAVKGIREEVPVDELLARTIGRARDAGGLVLVNHPTFGAALSSATLAAAPPFELLEIFSAHPAVPAGPAEESWDALLTAGRRVHGAAVDDAHDFLNDGEFRRPGGAWVEAWDAGSRPASLCEALREGRFYASKGTRLERLAVRGDELEVAVADFSPASDRVEFVGAGGRVLAVADRSPARFRLRGDEAYVRARVTQAGGRRAWTQAYFVRP